MGKLTRKQVLRIRKTYLKEITPEWVEYETKCYAIDDEFDETVKTLRTSEDIPKWYIALDKAVADKNALVMPKTWPWLPGKEPQIGDDWDRTKHPLPPKGGWA